MIADDFNEVLTKVGPTAPMGTLFRRYWLPVGTLNDLETRWTKKVRVLGEDLVLFKDRRGQIGLIQGQCPHRCASLAYGIPTEHGIRCAYHGWHFDHAGHCLDMPAEQKPDVLKDKAIAVAYPVQEMGGLYWAYLGPTPAPLLPRFEGFVVDNAIRMIGEATIPANWLQIMENSVDPIHAEWLHGHHYEFIKEGEGKRTSVSRRHIKIAFDEFPFGIIKRRLLEGQNEESDDWKVGHPLLFPNMLSLGNGSENDRFYSFQIRVPIDDTTTKHFWYAAYVPPRTEDIPSHLYDRIAFYEVPFLDSNGEHIVDFIDGEDIMAWVTQGPIANRENERLGSSDSGVIMFRRMLQRELEKIEKGEDPIGILRDPSNNGMIELPVEHNRHHLADAFAQRIGRSQARYSPIREDLIKIFGAPRPDGDKDKTRTGAH